MATEKRLIDANALIDKFWQEECRTQTRRDFVAMVNYAPTVDAVEVVHGRWIEYEDMVESYLADCTEVFYECSACGVQQVIGKTPYCPNCGAKMDGGNYETD